MWKESKVNAMKRGKPIRYLEGSGLVLALLLAAASCESTSGNGGRITVGTGCTSNDDCTDICLDYFANGFCTMRCMSSSECPAETICVDTEDPVGGVCLYTCTSTAECNDRLGSGYVCDTESEMGVDDEEDVRVCVD